MKKVNLLAIIAVILVAIIAATVVFIAVKDNKDDTNILNFSTIDEVKNYAEDNNIEKYSFDNEYGCLREVEVLGSTADVEFYFSKGTTSQIVAKYIVFQHEYEYSEDESVEIPLYKFTEKDKKEISEDFKVIKTAFEEKIGCTLEQFDALPTQEGITLDNSDEQFYQGLFIKEYSVRDKSGVLWLLRFEASNDFAVARLEKIIDDSSFDGFIPHIDLSK